MDDEKKERLHQQVDKLIIYNCVLSKEVVYDLLELKAFLALQIHENFNLLRLNLSKGE